MYEKPKNDYSMELADTGARFFAILLDGLILGFITGIFVSSAGNAGWGLNFIFTLAYNWYFWTRSNGQTPGKRAMGIRVIKNDGGPLSDTDALIRATGYYLNSMFFGIGWIWALFDSQRRGWHDILANTVVVKA